MTGQEIYFRANCVIYAPRAVAGLAFLACLAVAQQADWLALQLDLFAVETVLADVLQEEVEVLLLTSPACAAEANANTPTVRVRINLFIGREHHNGRGVAMKNFHTPDRCTTDRIAFMW